MVERKVISQDPGDVQAWYRNYYRRKGADRDDPMNPEVVFQEFAYRCCFIDAFAGIPRNAKILDVGGGIGNGLTRLLDLQFDRAGLHLLDLHPDFVTRARAQLGEQGIVEGSATEMIGFGDGSMDVVYSASTFIHLDPAILKDVCAEMLRVLRPGGRLMIFDWDMARSSDPFVPVTRKRLEKLLANYPVRYVKASHGPLYPPLGRRLSRYLPALYFMVRGIGPLIGFHGHIFQKLG